jgi:hypothetical protein
MKLLFTKHNNLLCSNSFINEIEKCQKEVTQSLLPLIYLKNIFTLKLCKVIDSTI